MNEQKTVQVTIAQLEQKIETASEWETLLRNPLFDKLVSREYLGDDAVRIIMGLKPEAQKNEVSNSLLFAKSAFSRYVAGKIEDGKTALSGLEENTALQAELDKEEV